MHATREILYISEAGRKGGSTACTKKEVKQERRTDLGKDGGKDARNDKEGYS